MNPRLIGFTGLAGSGKDTAGQVFVDHAWQKFSFAEPLKAMLRTLLEFRLDGSKGTYPAQYTDGDRKEHVTDLLMGKTARHAMQTLGTEWGRDLIHPDLWIDTFKRRASRAMRDGTGIVVTDVRFPNEVEAIKSLGGKVFRVVRDPGPVVSGMHSSEALVTMLSVDAEIFNDFPTARDFQVHIEKRFF